jgi:hypothetical protein
MSSPPPRKIPIWVYGVVAIVVIALVLGLGLGLGLKNKKTSPAPPAAEKELQPPDVTVGSVKTGDAVEPTTSPYSLRKTEYAGTCTFMPSMNEFVKLQLTIRPAAGETNVQYVDAIKVNWKVGSEIWSTETITTDVKTRLKDSAGLKVELKSHRDFTDPTKNIVCAAGEIERTDNVIEILYSLDDSTDYKTWFSQKFTFDPKIVTAFATLTTGEVLPVIMKDLKTKGGSLDQKIPYKFVPKQGTLVNNVFLKKLSTNPDDTKYEITYKNKTEAVDIYRLQFESYKGYVAFKNANGKFIAFTPTNEIMYKDKWDDASFFKLIIDEPIKFINGYDDQMFNTFTVFDTWLETNPRVQYTTAQSCADLATVRGAESFLWRDTHSTEPEKFSNTCVGISRMPANPGTLPPLWGAGPREVISGCVDPAKTWPMCGTNTSWCYKYDGVGTPIGWNGVPYVWLWDVGASDIARKTLADIKTSWNTPGLMKLAGQTDDLKTQGYKYAATTIAQSSPGSANDSNYYVYVAFGKTLPASASMNTEDAGCSYGGTPESSTTYQVGRKPDSFVFMNPQKTNKDGDTWGGTTYKIYDLTQV